MPLDPHDPVETDNPGANSFTTRRATVAAMEDLLYEPRRVLDHGFVRVIDYMGDDGAIVQAARVSYGRGTKQVSSDRGLINYLMRNRHTSPFEMCEIKLHLKMPIFVARQWIRHRTASVNEYSARYSVLDREFFVPDQEFLRLQKAAERAAPAQPSLFEPASRQPQQTAAQSTTNKQGREALLDPDDATTVLREISRISSASFTAYEKLLGSDERPGVARELARMVLPLSTYTQLYWKIDLHNLLQFIALRADPHAQAEIRVYAEVLLDVVRRWVPLTAAAFQDYRLDAVTLSSRALAAAQLFASGEHVDREEAGLSIGEWRELQRLKLAPATG